MSILNNVDNANVQDNEIHNVGGDYNRQTTNFNTTVYANSEPFTLKFLDLLPHVECEPKHNRIKHSIRTRPTVGRWLLESETYKMWKSGLGDPPRRLLWLNGIPGVGKTVICSRVIDDLRDNQDLPVVFFYCGEEDIPTKYDSTTILACLLRQLLNYAPHDSSKYSRILKRYQWTENVDDSTLTQLMKEISLLYGRIFIIIDALDECSSLEVMLSEFVILAERLSIFVSSRDHADIRMKFECYERIRIQEDNLAEDLRQYVTQEVTSLKIRNTKLRNAVINNLVNGAQGSFLWPVSQVQRLRKARTDKEMEEILATIPQGMRNAIEKSLKAIDSKNNKEHLRSALQLVVCALRPITLQALAEVMGTLEMNDLWDTDLITTELRVLVDDFGGLLISESVSGKEKNGEDIVVPFHRCVKEYLLADPVILSQDLLEYSLHPQSANHDSIAKLCLRYQKLVLKHTYNLDLDPAHYPFAEYALREWLPHTLASGKDIGDLRQRESISAGVVIKTPSSNLASNSARVGSGSEVRKGLGLDKTKLIAEDNKGLSPLHIAIKNSATIEDIDRLLQEGADVKQLRDETHSATALHFAIMYHQEPRPIINLLLEAGADVNATAKGGITALHILLEWYSAERALSCLVPLLEHGANANAGDAKSRTPFHVLAQRAQLSDFLEPIVELLLKHAADINARDDEDKTPLHLAAQSGCVPLVAALLANGAAVDPIDNSSCTPLGLAAKFADLTPHRVVIEQLRGHGADWNLTRQNVHTIDTSKRYYIKNRVTGRVWRLYGDNNEYYVNCSPIFVRGAAQYQWKISRAGEDQGIMFETCQATGGGYYKVTDGLDAAYASQNASSFHFVPVKAEIDWYFIATGPANDNLQVVTEHKEETNARMSVKPIVWNDPYQMWQLLEVSLDTPVSGDIPEVTVLDKVISKFGVVMERRQWLGCQLPKTNVYSNKGFRCRIGNRVSRRVLTLTLVPNTNNDGQNRHRIEYQNDYGQNTVWDMETQKRPPPGLVIQNPFTWRYITEDLRCVSIQEATNAIYLIQVPNNPNWYFIIIDTQYDPPLAITDAGGDNGFKSPAILALDDKTQMWELSDANS